MGYRHGHRHDFRGGLMPEIGELGQVTAWLDGSPR
jgi:hypothetical protein